jgi:hypothetical protein
VVEIFHAIADHTNCGLERILRVLPVILITLDWLGELLLES